MQSFQKRSEQNLPSTMCIVETLSSAATKAKNCAGFSNATVPGYENINNDFI